jgi:tRNA acetyltransferase TAN1
VPDTFAQHAAQMWPVDDSSPSNLANEPEASDEETEDDDGDIEKQIAKEMSTMKRAKTEKRFGAS